MAQVHSNFLAVRIMHDGEMSLFAAGRYLDRIDLTSQPYRFIERLVVLDSQQIDAAGDPALRSSRLQPSWTRDPVSGIRR
jgi:3-phenylpropionate/cinnamic acid dioxygenase small subunit